MNHSTVDMIVGSELPPIVVQFLDDNGDPVDLTSATFTLKLGLDTTTTALTKTSGITGSTTGATVNFSAGQLELAAGRYVAELTATISGLDHRRQFVLNLLPKLA